MHFSFRAGTRENLNLTSSYTSLASGSISYSEGTNDDVNKFIWTAQDWDPLAKVIETLHDYAHYFIGNGYDEGVAQGLMALEKNFRGGRFLHMINRYRRSLN